jgi:hypothetical protein
MIPQFLHRKDEVSKMRNSLQNANASVLESP